MDIEVQDVSVDCILDYVLKQPQTRIPVWEKVVLDQTTIIPMMRNGNHARLRKGFGLFVGRCMVGYAVIDESKHSLELLHISAGVRGHGLSTFLLKQLHIKSVSVDEANHVAIKLYRKLGYTIDLIKEEE